MMGMAKVMHDRPWWGAHERGDKEGPFQDLWGLASQLKRKQALLRQNTRKLMAVYQWGARASEYWEETTAPLDQSTLYFNIAQNICNTTAAKTCKTRIRPMPLTEGRGYLSRRRARDLGRALEGVFDDNSLEAIKEDVVHDALETDHGAGCAMVFREHGKLVIQHLPIEDVMIDDTEARYRRPRTWIRRILMDRYVALEKFGIKDECLYGTVSDRREAIKGSPSTNELSSDARTSAWGDTDQIELIEAWHLRSRPDTDDGPGSDDGWHAIVSEKGTMVYERYDRDRPPLAFYVPQPRRRHFWGISLMRQLVSGQTEFEKLSEKIQDGHEKVGVAQFIASRQANMDAREFTNRRGVLYQYDGQVRPEPFNFDPIPAGVYAYKDSVAQAMSQFTALSQWSTSSQVPSGLQQASGKALQLVDDVESERLLPYTKPLERWVIDLMWLVVDEVEEALREGETEFSVNYRGKQGLERLMWSELLGAINDNGQATFKRGYDFQVFPVSNLARTPAAKFQQLTEMLNSGAITVEQFKRLYELPDMESELEIDSADTDVIDMWLDLIVTKGQYNSPEGFQDIQLALKRARKFYNLCIVHGEIPEERMSLLRDFIADLKAEDDKQKAVAQAMQPAAPAAPGPMGPPGAGAPPTPMAA